MSNNLPPWLTYLTVLFAPLALIRPDIERWVRRKRARLHLSLTNKVIVSYTGSGPLIQLKGSIRAVYDDVYVGSLSIRVLRNKDNAEHVFSWYLALPLTVGGNMNAPAEMVTATNVRKSQPYRFNLLFQDEALFDEMGEAFSSYKLAWQIVEERLQASKLTPNSAEKAVDDAVSEFKQSIYYQKVFKQLDKMNYWEHSSYTMEV